MENSTTIYTKMFLENPFKRNICFKKHIYLTKKNCVTKSTNLGSRNQQYLMITNIEINFRPSKKHFFLFSVHVKLGICYNKVLKFINSKKSDVKDTIPNQTV